MIGPLRERWEAWRTQRLLRRIRREARELGIAVEGLSDAELAQALATIGAEAVEGRGQERSNDTRARA